jgi:hypothetical protein
VLGADGPTGAGAGEAVGRGATDVTAEWGDATLGALIVSLGGAFLAPVTRFGFAFSALTFVARRCRFRGGLLGLRRLLGRLLRRRGFAGLSVCCGYRFDGVLGGRLASLLLRCLRCRVREEHSAMRLQRLPCSIEAETRHCACREFTSTRRNQLG